MIRRKAIETFWEFGALALARACLDRSENIFGLDAAYDWAQRLHFASEEEHAALLREYNLIRAGMIRLVELRIRHVATGQAPIPN